MPMSDSVSRARTKLGRLLGSENVCNPRTAHLEAGEGLSQSTRLVIKRQIPIGLDSHKKMFAPLIRAIISQFGRKVTGFFGKYLLAPRSYEIYRSAEIKKKKIISRPFAPPKRNLILPTNSFLTDTSRVFSVSRSKRSKIANCRIDRDTVMS